MTRSGSRPFLFPSLFSPEPWDFISVLSSSSLFGHCTFALGAHLGNGILSTPSKGRRLFLHNIWGLLCIFGSSSSEPGFQLLRVPTSQRLSQFLRRRKHLYTLHLSVAFAPDAGNLSSIFHIYFPKGKKNCHGNNGSCLISRKEGKILCALQKKRGSHNSSSSSFLDVYRRRIRWGLCHFPFRQRSSAGARVAIQISAAIHYYFSSSFFFFSEATSTRRKIPLF